MATVGGGVHGIFVLTVGCKAPEKRRVWQLMMMILSAIHTHIVARHPKKEGYGNETQNESDRL